MFEGVIVPSVNADNKTGRMTSKILINFYAENTHFCRHNWATWSKLLSLLTFYTDVAQFETHCLY
jgi:hypothetical protein